MQFALHVAEAPPGIANVDLLHYDGVAWTTVETGNQTLRAVAGSSGHDVLVVGMSGAVAHFDDKAWSVELVPTSQSLWHAWATDGEAFAVGDGGTILHRAP